MRRLEEVTRRGATAGPALRKLIGSLLLSEATPYSDDVWGYLEKFSLESGSYVARPSMVSDGGASNVRDLLMELEVVTYDPVAGEYRIAEPYYFPLLRAESGRKRSSSELARILAERDEIGRLAELAVLEYERQRLASNTELAACVKHVAPDDVAAGYDILSFELKPNKDGQILPRYVEVKAIGGGAVRFFWTRNERKVAACHGDRYFLYLLPVLGRGEFDFSRMEVIQNPVRAVLEDKEHWIGEAETMVFTRVE